MRQLCAQARAGSPAAREQLLRAHLRLVVHVAAYFYRPGCFCELGDLVQQGCLGLLHAITKFNPMTVSRGRRVRFATYAHFWVSHCIRREIENNGRTISDSDQKTPRGEKSLVICGVDGSGRMAGRRRRVCFGAFSGHRTTPLSNWCRAWEARQDVECLLKQLPERKQVVLKHRFGLGIQDLSPSRSARPDGRLWASAPLSLGSSSDLRCIICENNRRLSFSKQIRFNIAWLKKNVVGSSAPLRMSIWICMTPKGHAVIGEGRFINVSLTGSELESRQPLHLNQHIRLQVQSPTRSAVEFAGKIVWRKKKSAVYNYGIQFARQPVSTYSVYITKEAAHVPVLPQCCTQSSVWYV